ncbi:MAG: hypothetical protein KC933_37865 [Myxococcales bacterium]|nr:hypothetical protein [Myxococcales bacterium]
MNRRKMCMTALLLLAPACQAGGSTPGSAEEPPALRHPESVVHGAGRHFVSNIGARLDPLGKDGDGFISEVDGQGSVIARHAFPPPGMTLDAPKGMAIVDGVLYVADIDRVVGFSLEPPAQVFEVVLERKTPVLLNDLEVEDGRRLLVSDTLGGCLLRLDLPTTTFTIVTCGIPGANGVARVGGTAYVVGVGSRFEGGDLYEVSLASGVARLIPGVHGILDGVAASQDGALVISDWVSIDPPKVGRVIRFDPRDGTSTPIASATPLEGPADLSIDDTGRLWLPLTRRNQVEVSALP